VLLKVKKELRDSDHALVLAGRKISDSLSSGDMAFLVKE
jgi:hypothetical protein